MREVWGDALRLMCASPAFAWLRVPFVLEGTLASPPPPVPGHTPRPRFACARPFRFTKGAEASAALQWISPFRMGERGASVASGVCGWGGGVCSERN